MKNPKSNKRTYWVKFKNIDYKNNPNLLINSLSEQVFNEIVSE